MKKKVLTRNSSKETEQETAFRLHSSLIEFIQYSKKGFVLMGKLLYELKQSSKFKLAIGKGIDTWDDYIAQPEIQLSKGEAERLSQIYEYFVIQYGISEEELSEVPIKSLHYLLPIAKKNEDKDDMKEMVLSASTLSQKDFKERIGELKYGDDRTYEYLVMKRCIQTGTLTKVHDISSQDIKNSFKQC